MDNTKEDLKLSEYAKVFILLLKVFQDVDKACKWMQDYGAMYKDGDNIVNWAGINVTGQYLLDRIKIFVNKKEWDE
jgi:hypothetical protein